jgi:hypothetical protein
VTLGESLLLIGTIGVGKTIVASEMCEILGGRNISAAVIDLDWLGWVSPSPPDGPSKLIVENLKAVLPNFLNAGIDRFVLSRTITDAAQVDAIRKCMPDSRLHVVRLVASRSTVAERLRRRDSGVTLEQHLAESVEFEDLAPGVEDFSVANEDRAPYEVADEILRKVGWV